MKDTSAAEAVRNAASLWVTYPRPNPRAEKRIFCFPYAGGSSILFRRWPEMLPDNIEVAAIELPGRGRRLAEPLMKEISAIVEMLAEGIYLHLDKPFCLSGHSMGALIAYELACRLKKTLGLETEHLFVSAHAAPHLCKKENPLYNLPKPEFIERLKALNGIPKEVLSNEELMELVIPILRADFTVCETYEFGQDMLLDCPITAFGGVFDTEVRKPDLEAWAHMTSRPFKFHLLPGDHFFISKCEGELMRLLYDKLSGNGLRY